MIDINVLLNVAVVTVTAVVRVIGSMSLSEEAAQKHLDELFVRIDKTRAQVHAEAEETKRIAEDLHG